MWALVTTAELSSCDEKYLDFGISQYQNTTVQIFEMLYPIEKKVFTMK